MVQHGPSLFGVGLHGLYLSLQRGASSVVKNWSLPKCVSCTLGWGAVMFGVFLAWVFFRAQSFEQASVIVGKILGLNDFGVDTILRKVLVAKGAVIIGAVMFLELAAGLIDFDRWAKSGFLPNAAFGVLCLLGLSFLGSFGESAFIYFQF